MCWFNFVNYKYLVWDIRNQFYWEKDNNRLLIISLYKSFESKTKLWFIILKIIDINSNAISTLFL